jgi:hypothetical protein
MKLQLEMLINILQVPIGLLRATIGGLDIMNLRMKPICKFLIRVFKMKFLACLILMAARILMQL